MWFYSDLQYLLQVLNAHFWQAYSVVLKVFFIVPLKTRTLSIPPNKNNKKDFAKISHYLDMVPDVFWRFISGIKLNRPLNRRLWAKQTLTTSVTAIKAVCPCVLQTFPSKPTPLLSFLCGKSGMRNLILSRAALIVDYRWRAVLKFYLYLTKKTRRENYVKKRDTSLDLLFTCLLAMEFHFDAILCSNLGNENPDANQNRFFNAGRRFPTPVLNKQIMKT